MDKAIGENTYISEKAVIGKDVIIGNHVSIKDGAVIGDGATIQDGSIIGQDSVVEKNVYIDYDVIIRENVVIGEETFIGAKSIIGEYLVDFMDKRDKQHHKTSIGAHSLLRSGTIIYGENNLGEYMQTGHRVTIRENAQIGHHVRIGTMTDIQGYCKIGNYVNMHSNCHIAQKTVLEDYVWLFPWVIFTNDPTPPSEQLVGITVEKYAVIATRTVLLPGVTVKQGAMVGAGAVVTKDVREEMVVVGNPIHEVGDIKMIKNKVTGENVYPWRYHFDRGMPWQDVGFEEWEKSESGKMVEVEK